jgi:hypothetical protein
MGIAFTLYATLKIEGFGKNMSRCHQLRLELFVVFQSKVIRVLNLWQKNSVFQSEVIQPLFDLADPNHPIHKEQQTAVSNTSNGSISVILNSSTVNKTPPSAVNRTPSNLNKTSMNAVKPDATSTPMWMNISQSQMEVTSSALLQLSGQTGMNLLSGKSQVIFPLSALLDDYFLNCICCIMVNGWMIINPLKPCGYCLYHLL